MTSPFRSGGVLQYLLGPGGVEALFGEHWESAPLLVQGRNPDYYDPLLTREQLYDYLESDDLHHPPVRLARMGGVATERYVRSRSFGEVRVDGFVDHDALFTEFAQGASILVDRAHEVFPSLGCCAAALQEATGLPAQASVFLSPAAAQAMRVHYDPQGVFVLQVAGEKRWRLFEEPKPWPVLETYDPEEVPDEDAPVREFHLLAGDALYVPRGHYHQVLTGEQDSIHISLGFAPLTWIGILRDIVTELAQDAEYRKAPVEQLKAIRDFGALRRQFRVLLQKMADSDALMRVWQRQEEALGYPRGMTHRGRLADIATLDGIGPSTALRRRDGIDVRVRPSPDGCRIEFGGKALTLPPELQPALELLAAGGQLCAADLEELEEESALVLLRLFVREGLLTEAPGADGVA